MTGWDGRQLCINEGKFINLVNSITFIFEVSMYFKGLKPQI